MAGHAKTASGPLGQLWGARASGEALEELLAGSRERLRIRPAGEDAWRRVSHEKVADLSRVAAAERGTPWPQPLVSDYSRYFRDGNRTAYEGLIGARQARLSRAVVM